LCSAHCSSQPIFFDDAHCSGTSVSVIARLYRSRHLAMRHYVFIIN
jgi:hypothetical protein